jgi:hypothetical protein
MTTSHYRSYTVISAPESWCLTILALYIGDLGWTRLCCVCVYTIEFIIWLEQWIGENAILGKEGSGYAKRGFERCGKSQHACVDVVEDGDWQALCMLLRRVGGSFFCGDMER